MGTFVAMGLVALFFFIGIAAIATSVSFEITEGTWIGENSVLNLDLNTSIIRIGGLPSTHRAFQIWAQD